jgi:hypothetical protein
MTRTTFSNALHGLMTETGVGSLWVWSIVLDTDQVKIQEWFDNISLPSPDTLALVLLKIEETLATGTLHYKKFHDLMDSPLYEISPLGNPNSPTLGEYIRRPRHPY